MQLSMVVVETTKNENRDTKDRMMSTHRSFFRLEHCQASAAIVNYSRCLGGYSPDGSISVLLIKISCVH
jgi:hypothetical protein